MTDLPLRREDRTMRDPKKQTQAQAQAQTQAQAQAQKRKVTYDEWSEICEHREALNEIFEEVYKRFQPLGIKDKVTLTLIEDKKAPVIVFDFEDEDFLYCDTDSIIMEESGRRKLQNFEIPVSDSMGFLWKWGNVMRSESEPPKRVIGLVMKRFVKKESSDGGGLIVITEKFETSNKRDSMCVLSEVLHRVEELYYVPFALSIGAEKFRELLRDIWLSGDFDKVFDKVKDL